MWNATRRDLHSSSSAIVSVEENGVIGSFFLGPVQKATGGAQSRPIDLLRIGRPA